MKVAIVTDVWHPQINGVVTTLAHLSEELRNMGHEPVVIGPDRFATVPCPTYGEIRLSLFPGKELRKVMKKCDSIHICTEGPLGYAARKICKDRGWAFTSSFHTKLPEYINLRFGFIPVKAGYKIVRRFHRRSRCVLVPTKSIKKELEKHGFERTKVWSRGVDTELFRPQAVEISSCRPVLLYVGRVAVEKNLDSFLSLDMPGTKVVVGDGPDKRILEERYPDALFVGFKTGEELAKFYAGADVFVFPSLTDTLGLVQLEAMACGTPVAAYPVPGPLDIVKDGRTGSLDKDLKAAVEKALAMSREECREYAAAFSWRRCAKKFLKALVPRK